MAIGATMYRFGVELSDIDRGVYESFEVRAARHASETARYLLTRVLGYCLLYEEGIALGAGISSPDEPAIAVTDRTGQRHVWVEVGHASAERLHRAAKATPRVVVLLHEDPKRLLAELAKKPIHRQAELELLRLPDSLLDPLEETLTRNETWLLTVNEGLIYLVRGEESLEGVVLRVEPPS